MTASAQEAGERTAPCVSLGVLVAPGLAHDVTAKVVEDLLEDLRGRYESVAWRTELQVDRLVAPPVTVTEIVDAARRSLLESDWDLAVVVTDLPLRLGGRAVSRHVSPTHGVALVSLPALGAIHLRPRLRRALLELVDELAGLGGDDSHGADGVRGRLRRRWERRVLRELATDTADRAGALRFLFAFEVVAGHLRLLLGMVRANRPWRFAARLYTALVAALAVGAFGLVTSDIWRISGAMGWWRLTLLNVLSLAVTIAAVIVVHGLWEREPDPRVRDQVVLFNAATAATVAIGIASLYLALFALILAGAALILTSRVLAPVLGHGVGLPDYAALAWFVASFATIGGALGAGLESREAVREAAYASHPDEAEGRVEPDED